jgi:hypothetical protein
VALLLSSYTCAVTFTMGKEEGQDLIQLVVFGLKKGEARPTIFFEDDLKSEPVRIDVILT